MILFACLGAVDDCWVAGKSAAKGLSARTKVAFSNHFFSADCPGAGFILDAQSCSCLVVLWN